MNVIKEGIVKYNQYSSWIKIVRIMGWTRRFCSILKARTFKNETTYGVLTVVELLKAEKLLCKEIHSLEFCEEHAQLAQNRAILKKSKLLQLSPYLDQDGIIRVGGRISKAAIPEMIKHQIILPGKHKLVYLLIKYYHDKSQSGTEYV